MGNIKFGGERKRPQFSKPRETAFRDINYGPGPEDIEKDTKTELTELQVAFRNKAAAEKSLQIENTDTENFSVIVFKTREQREQFSQLLNLRNEDNQYINGSKLLAALTQQIDQIALKSPGKFKVNKEIANLALDISDYQ